MGEGEDKKVINGLRCFVCQEMVPSDQYSKKQKKKKGKRKCNKCVASGATEQKGMFKGFVNQNTKKKQIVKAVLADEVKRAQEAGGRGSTNIIAEDEDKYDRLLRWLKDGGAKFPNLQLKYYTVDYRGIHARKRLDADELILEVPLHLIMTSDVAKASKVGQAIQKSNCQLRSSHSWLAAFLLQEKYNPDSKWKAYIDTLPQHYRNMPIFFDDEELKWLKGSMSLKMIEDRKVSLKIEYDNIVKHVPSYRKYHYLDFFWARLAVITRIFGFQVDGRKTDGLVAMADMLNHKRPNETSWTFDQSRKAFTITTTKRLLKGQQVFDSYGRKCNSRYFVNYGFSLDFNEDNQVALFFDLPIPEGQSNSLTQVKKKLLGTSKRRFQIPFEHKERVTRKCLSYLRVAYATQEELEPLLSLPSIEKIVPISLENEYQCMREVRKACQTALAGFDTTLEEDNKLLNDSKSQLTMNIRNCVLMRRGEKEVLHAYVDLVDRLDVVYQWKDKSRMRDLRRYLNKEVNGKEREPSIAWRREKYFEEMWMPLITGNKKELEEMNNSLGE